MHAQFVHSSTPTQPTLFFFKNQTAKFCSGSMFLFFQQFEDENVLILFLSAIYFLVAENQLQFWFNYSSGSQTKFVELHLNFIETSVKKSKHPESSTFSTLQLNFLLAIVL